MRGPKKKAPWSGEPPARPPYPDERRAAEEARRKTLFRLAKDLPAPHGEQIRTELVKSLVGVLPDNDDPTKKVP
jgi:hypothetical protein